MKFQGGEENAVLGGVSHVSPSSAHRQRDSDAYRFNYSVNV